MIPRLLPLLLLALGLSACSLLPRVGPDYQPAPPPVAHTWHAPLPHGGDPVALADWWQQLDDPALAQLLAATEAASPSLPQAAARIAQARSELTTANANQRPSLDASAAAKRAAFSYGSPTSFQTTRQGTLMSSWELDLFGGLARAEEASQARLNASQARWHEARVSLAAETASTYLQLRLTERQRARAQGDADSLAQSAQLQAHLYQAGLASPDQAALAQAQASDAQDRLATLQASHAQQLKALVALSGLDETALGRLLTLGQGQFPAPRSFALPPIPAQLLTQRPDVAAAERDVAAASAAIGQAQAARYPRLTLSGFFSPTLLNTDGSRIRAQTWSVGPSLSLPIFDGGRIQANEDAAQAQYTAAASTYQQKVRDAVSEVEQALVRLDAARTRQQAVAQSVSHYQRAFQAAQERHRLGLASPLELEDSRRTWLAADLNLATIEHERMAAWITLYRALGGGWNAAAPAPVATAATAPLASGDAE
jgi:NodT family efflux transporter outer membrane factor (OMF) lipoprotein